MYREGECKRDRDTLVPQRSLLSIFISFSHLHRLQKITLIKCNHPVIKHDYYHVSAVGFTVLFMKGDAAKKQRRAQRRHTAVV